MEKSPGINRSDLELPVWLTLRSTSRRTVPSGTMTGLEVTKADGSLLMVVTAGHRNISLAHSVGKGQYPKLAGVWGGGLLTSPK